MPTPGKVNTAAVDFILISLPQLKVVFGGTGASLIAMVKSSPLISG
jgi:hypothetical protein